MPRLVLVPIDRPEVAPMAITPRLRNQLVYFMQRPGFRLGIPELGEHDFWFDPDEVAKWVDEGVFYLVSPLDTDNMTEVELSEEQEVLIAWLHSEQRSGTSASRSADRFDFPADGVSLFRKISACPAETDLAAGQALAVRAGSCFPEPWDLIRPVRQTTMS